MIQVADNDYLMKPIRLSAVSHARVMGYSGEPK
jgi:hypothetical protein